MKSLKTKASRRLTWKDLRCRLDTPLRTDHFAGEDTVALQKAAASEERRNAPVRTRSTRPVRSDAHMPRSLTRSCNATKSIPELIA